MCIEYKLKERNRWEEWGKYVKEKKKRADARHQCEDRGNAFDKSDDERQRNVPG
jgi:hypothetical protein